MSLLIIHCPPKPFASATGKVAESSRADQFAWYLCEHPAKETAEDTAVGQHGVGSPESMPYADEVLVLIPTLDVRLIETKVPLVKAKKLQQVLPSLVEEYLLAGTDGVIVHALPPLPGQIGSQRTLAIIDRAWFYWLNQQLATLLAPRMRFIPDCLVLSYIKDGDSSLVNAAQEITIPSLAYKNNENAVIFTWRKSEQVGLAWVEQAADAQLSSANLPSTMGSVTPVEWSWDWLAPSAIAFSRRTDIAAASLNLMLAAPNTRKTPLKLNARWQAAQTKGLSGLSNVYQSWTDRDLWLTPSRWAIYAIGSIFIGFSLNAAWLAVDYWRWGRNLEMTATQFLSPTSVALLAQNKTTDSVVTTLVKQLTQEERRKGLSTDADFVPMAAKLQQLKVALGKETLQKITYDGFHVDFEFKPNASPISASEIIVKAQLLGMMVSELGNDRFRLEPYAGLGNSIKESN